MTIKQITQRKMILIKKKFLEQRLQVKRKKRRQRRGQKK